ncbi:hypothetical protein JCM5296_003026 [Sporobolomyces johnsonii]
MTFLCTYDELSKLFDKIEDTVTYEPQTPDERRLRNAVMQLINHAQIRIPNSAVWALLGREYRDRQENVLPEGETRVLVDKAGHRYRFHNYQNAVVDKLLFVLECLDHKPFSEDDVMDTPI